MPWQKTEFKAIFLPRQGQMHYVLTLVERLDKRFKLGLALTPRKKQALLQTFETRHNINLSQLSEEIESGSLEAVNRVLKTAKLEIISIGNNYRICQVEEKNVIGKISDWFQSFLPQPLLALSNAGAEDSRQTEQFRFEPTFLMTGKEENASGNTTKRIASTEELTPEELAMEDEITDPTLLQPGELTTGMLAERLGISRSTVNNAINDGRLKKFVLKTIKFHGKDASVFHERNIEEIRKTLNMGIQPGELTTSMLAEKLGVSQTTVNYAINNGRLKKFVLKTVKMSGKNASIFLERDVDKIKEAMKNKPIMDAIFQAGELTTKMLAKRLAVSRPTIHRAINDGRLKKFVVKTTKIYGKGTSFFHESDIDKIREAMKNPPPAGQNLDVNMGLEKEPEGEGIETGQGLGKTQEKSPPTQVPSETPTLPSEETDIEELTPEEAAMEDEITDPSILQPGELTTGMLAERLGVSRKEILEKIRDQKLNPDVNMAEDKIFYVFNEKDVKEAEKLFPPKPKEKSPEASLLEDQRLGEGEEIEEDVNIPYLEQGELTTLMLAKRLGLSKSIIFARINDGAISNFVEKTVEIRGRETFVYLEKNLDKIKQAIESAGSYKLQLGELTSTMVAKRIGVSKSVIFKRTKDGTLAAFVEKTIAIGGREAFIYLEKDLDKIKAALKAVEGYKLQPGELTIPMLAEKINMSISTVYRKVENGTIANFAVKTIVTNFGQKIPIFLEKDLGEIKEVLEEFTQDELQAGEITIPQLMEKLKVSRKLVNDAIKDGRIKKEWIKRTARLHGSIAYILDENYLKEIDEVLKTVKTGELTTTDLAERLKVSDGTVRYAINDGRLAPFVVRTFDQGGRECSIFNEKDFDKIQAAIKKTKPRLLLEPGELTTTMLAKKLGVTSSTIRLAENDGRISRFIKRKLQRSGTEWSIYHEKDIKDIKEALGSVAQGEITVAKLAEMLKIGKTTIRRAIKNGEISRYAHVKKVRGKDIYFFYESELEEVGKILTGNQEFKIDAKQLAEVNLQEDIEEVDDVLPANLDARALEEALKEATKDAEEEDIPPLVFQREPEGKGLRTGVGEGLGETAPAQAPTEPPTLPSEETDIEELPPKEATMEAEITASSLLQPGELPKLQPGELTSTMLAKKLEVAYDTVRKTINDGRIKGFVIKTIKIAGRDAPIFHERDIEKIRTVVGSGNYKVQSGEITVSILAEKLGVDSRTIYKAINDGRIKKFIIKTVKITGKDASVFHERDIEKIRKIIGSGNYEVQPGELTTSMLAEKLEVGQVTVNRAIADGRIKKFVMKTVKIAGKDASIFKEKDLEKIKKALSSAQYELQPGELTRSMLATKLDVSLGNINYSIKNGKIGKFIIKTVRISGHDSSVFYESDIDKIKEAMKNPPPENQELDVNTDKIEEKPKTERKPRAPKPARPKVIEFPLALIPVRRLDDQKELSYFNSLLDHFSPELAHTFLVLYYLMLSRGEALFQFYLKEDYMLEMVMEENKTEVVPLRELWGKVENIWRGIDTQENRESLENIQRMFFPKTISNIRLSRGKDGVLYQEGYEETSFGKMRALAFLANRLAEDNFIRYPGSIRHFVLAEWKEADLYIEDTPVGTIELTLQDILDIYQQLTGIDPYLDPETFYTHTRIPNFPAASAVDFRGQYELFNGGVDAILFDVHKKQTLSNAESAIEIGKSIVYHYALNRKGTPSENSQVKVWFHAQKAEKDLALKNLIDQYIRGMRLLGSEESAAALQREYLRAIGMEVPKKTEPIEAFKKQIEAIDKIDVDLGMKLRLTRHFTGASVKQLKQIHKLFTKGEGVKKIKNGKEPPLTTEKRKKIRDNINALCFLFNYHGRSEEQIDATASMVTERLLIDIYHQLYREVQDSQEIIDCLEGQIIKAKEQGKDSLREALENVKSYFENLESVSVPANCYGKPWYNQQGIIYRVRQILSNSKNRGAMLSLPTNAGKSFIAITESERVWQEAKIASGKGEAFAGKIIHLIPAGLRQTHLDAINDFTVDMGTIAAFEGSTSITEYAVFMEDGKRQLRVKRNLEISAANIEKILGKDGVLARAKRVILSQDSLKSMLEDETKRSMLDYLSTETTFTLVDEVHRLTRTRAEKPGEDPAAEAVTDLLGLEEESETEEIPQEKTVAQRAHASREFLEMVVGYGGKLLFLSATPANPKHAERWCLLLNLLNPSFPTKQEEIVKLYNTKMAEGRRSLYEDALPITVTMTRAACGLCTMQDEVANFDLNAFQKRMLERMTHPDVKERLAWAFWWNETLEAKEEALRSQGIEVEFRKVRIEDGEISPREMVDMITNMELDPRLCYGIKSSVAYVQNPFAGEKDWEETKIYDQLVSNLIEEKAPKPIVFADNIVVVKAAYEKLLSELGTDRKIIMLTGNEQFINGKKCESRQAALDAFKNDPQAVIVMSYRLGEGINELGSSEVVYYVQSGKNAMYDIQSSGRAMRGSEYAGRILPLKRFVPSSPSKTALRIEYISLFRTSLDEILYGNLEGEEETGATLRELKTEINGGKEKAVQKRFRNTQGSLEKMREVTRALHGVIQLLASQDQYPIYKKLLNAYLYSEASAALLDTAIREMDLSDGEKTACLKLLSLMENIAEKTYRDYLLNGAGDLLKGFDGGLIDWVQEMEQVQKIKVQDLLGTAIAFKIWEFEGAERQVLERWILENLGAGHTEERTTMKGIWKAAERGETDLIKFIKNNLTGLDAIKDVKERNLVMEKAAVIIGFRRGSSTMMRELMETKGDVATRVEKLYRQVFIEEMGVDPQSAAPAMRGKWRDFVKVLGYCLELERRNRKKKTKTDSKELFKEWFSNVVLKDKKFYFVEKEEYAKRINLDPQIMRVIKGTTGTIMVEEKDYRSKTSTSHPTSEIFSQLRNPLPGEEASPLIKHFRERGLSNESLGILHGLSKHPEELNLRLKEVSGKLKTLSLEIARLHSQAKSEEKDHKLNLLYQEQEGLKELKSWLTLEDDFKNVAILDAGKKGKLEQILRNWERPLDELERELPHDSQESSLEEWQKLFLSSLRELKEIVSGKQYTSVVIKELDDPYEVFHFGSLLGNYEVCLSPDSRYQLNETLVDLLTNPTYVPIKIEATPKGYKTRTVGISVAKIRVGENGNAGQIYLHMERPSKDTNHGYFEAVQAGYLEGKHAQLKEYLPGIHVSMYVNKGMDKKGEMVRVKSPGNIGAVEDCMDHSIIFQQGRAAHATLDITPSGKVKLLTE